MSENEIKPVDGAIPARKFDGQLWIPADVAIELRSKDRAAIDRLTAERDAAVAALDRIVSLKMSMFKDPCDMLGECVNIAARAIDAARSEGGV